MAGSVNQLHNKTGFPQGSTMSAAPILRVLVLLHDVEPPVIRRLELPGDITLPQLHPVLQRAIGWDNSHLYAFRCRDKRRDVFNKVRGDIYLEGWVAGDLINAETATIKEVLDTFKIKVREYIYDFGDNWTHGIKVEKVIAPEPGVLYPRLIEAQGRCPPEDVGGAYGFNHLLEMFRDPNHPDREDYCDWFDEGAELLDPEIFDPESLKSGGGGTCALLAGETGKISENEHKKRTRFPGLTSS
ncbi:MAG: plasmid pRiA4b ORF-3 family protein [Alphaproteobacteria bacterium]|nr:plasmid pRiA4b ORF-3 family protein [Alphaproteobacteria bacterium]